MAMARTREQVRYREVEADAEHQQDDADLRQLQRQPLVRHVAAERPDQDASNEVATSGDSAGGVPGPDRKASPRPTTMVVISGV
jgi:hypothetical protein